MSTRKYKKNNNRIPVLSADVLNMLSTLFLYKQWPIEDGVEFSVYERYCKTLLTMNTEQQKFFIKLSRNFLHIPIRDYLDYLIPSLLKLRKDEGEKNLIFLACLPQKDVGSAKSSISVLYQLKGTTIKQRVNLAPYYIVENIQRVDLSKISNSCLVLVDDFVGTGETATSAVNYVHELYPMIKDNAHVAVLCIVAMQEGIEALASMGVKTYCTITKKKGITEEFQKEDVEKAIALMNEIENKQKGLDKEFRFGYHKSEALVCMERCPNNTFPIYWMKKGCAPYER